MTARRFPPPWSVEETRCQFDFRFCVECFLSQRFIMARACNSAFSRDPMTIFPFISTPVG
jgi:hypothetical protein